MEQLMSLKAPNIDSKNGVGDSKTLSDEMSVGGNQVAKPYSKAYERYQLHPKRKLLEALADLIPDSGGWILICDDEKVTSFDITSQWDYGDSSAIIELADLKNEAQTLVERRDSLQRQVNSKTQKVAKLEKLERDLRRELKK
jgi:hypothetical protein